MTGFEVHHIVLAVLQVFAIGLVFVLFFLVHQRRKARQHEFSKLFLDKLSSEEFVDLLKSSAGRRSVERVMGSYKSPAEWVADAVQRAIILACIGIGCVVVFAVGASGTCPYVLPAGVLFISVSVGYFVAAAVTWGRARRQDGGSDL